MQGRCQNFLSKKQKSDLDCLLGTQVILRVGDLHLRKNCSIVALPHAGRKPLLGILILGKGKGRGISSRRLALLVLFVSVKNFCITEALLAVLVNMYITDS